MDQWSFQWNVFKNFWNITFKLSHTFDQSKWIFIITWNIFVKVIESLSSYYYCWIIGVQLCIAIIIVHQNWARISSCQNIMLSDVMSFRRIWHFSNCLLFLSDEFEICLTVYCFYTCFFKNIRSKSLFFAFWFFTCCFTTLFTQNNIEEKKSWSQ